MMTLLAKGLEWLVGAPKLMSTGAILAILVLAHQAWLARDERLRDQGEQTCQAEHQLAAMKAQRDQARGAVEAAVKAAEQQRQLTESMRHERETIREEFAAYKASADPRCLSDGVLELLRGGGQGGG